MPCHAPQVLPLIALLTLGWCIALSAADRGATIPWTTYEAEDMTRSNATLIGPTGLTKDRNSALPQTVAMEASGRRCVDLDQAGASVRFTARTAANAIVVRYCLPDAADGSGLDADLDLLVNGTKVATLPVTSRYSWRYGAYPFVNDPTKGNARNFFDEIRLKGLAIRTNDTVQVRRTAAQIPCIIDLVDLEDIPGPLTPPAGALDVTGPDHGADTTGIKDATAILQQCINDAQRLAKAVWIPAGTYLITGDLHLPTGSTIQGAGMWHTTLIGDPAHYNRPGGERRRVRLNGGGSNIRIADLAITGKLNYRNDSEANDGIDGSFGSGSTIARVWVEHTKAGAWVANSNGLVIEGCRFRNIIADGVNLCVGVRGSTVRDCTARGTGDDAFAIWPATYTAQANTPGLNVITNCTAVVTSLGNGMAVYGGESNAIQDCVARDIPFGCGILIAGTFPITDAKAGIDNRFAGTTVVQRCDLVRCGGWDSGWNAWRGALTVCPQNNHIAGLLVSEVAIADSLSYAVQFANPGGQKWLTDAILDRVTINGFGTAVPVAAPACDGVHAVVPAGRGGVAFVGLSVDGTAITQAPASGAAMRKATGDFTIAFAADVEQARLLNRSMAKPAAPTAPTKPTDGWTLKTIKASDLTTSTVNGAVIAGLAQGADADVVMTYRAGRQYGIHQIEYVDRLSAADVAGCKGIRLTVTSPNYGRLIVLPRDYESDGRAYEGSADIGLADQQTYEIPFTAMTRPGWAKGSAHDDAAAAIAAGERLDTLTIGWICNTAGLTGTVTVHNVEFYK